jgi:hypothetical protein
VAGQCPRLCDRGSQQSPLARHGRGRPIGRLDRAIDVCVAGFASGTAGFPIETSSSESSWRQISQKTGGGGNLSLPPLPSGAADRCTHSALGHACHDLRLSVDLPRYILPLPNSRYEKAGAASEQARSKARCGKADDDELAQPKVCCLLNFFSPAAPLRNYLAIDRSSLDVLARCRCIACISSDGKIIVRAYCVREQGPIAAAAAAAAAVPSAAVPLPPRACQLAESHHMLPHE